MSKKSSTFAPAFLRKGTLHQGKMAEWSNASVLKTDVRKRTGGSNPSLSARHSLLLRIKKTTPVQNKDRRFLLESWHGLD